VRPSRFIVLAFLLGCSGGKVSPGGNDADAGQPADAQAESDASATDAPANPLSGTYKGYIESFKFPDGSDTVVMTLTFASDGTVTGTVFFGDGPPLAPPTDPNVGYPPSAGGPMGPGGATIEGFDFTVIGGVYAAPRLTLQIQHSEIWKKWCEIQTMIYPKYNGESDGGCGNLLGYDCLPNAATMFGGSNCAWSSCDQPMWTPVDCGKLALCAMPGGICKCTSTSCTIPVGPMGDISFDMQLMAGALNGSTTGLQGSPALNVHLTRQ
jgi:hypothetical protein